jgi:hypothetical protein
MRVNLPWAVVLVLLGMWAFNWPEAEDFSDSVRYAVFQDGIPISDSAGNPLLYATEVEAGMALQKAANDNPQSMFSVKPEGEWLVAPQEDGIPVTPRPLETRLVWDYDCTGDAAPIVAKPLDGAVLNRTFFCVEVKLGFKPHHVIFKQNGTVQRRENYLPYTVAYTYVAGQTVLEAVVYSTETTIAEVIEARFLIDVNAGSTPNPAPLVSVTFEWTAPTSREDGTPLRPEEIANFALLWAQSRVLLDGSDTSATRTFPPGDYEFSMTAIDTTGLESLPSDTLRVSL